MSDRNIIKELREALVPKGTRDVIVLNLGTCPVYNGEFIRKCIDELELKAKIVACGMDEFTPLERLAFDVLLKSAHIKE